MKILRTNLVDTKFSHYEVRPFKIINCLPRRSYQCGEYNEPDYWCVVAFSETEELYPIAQFKFIADANLFAFSLKSKLTVLKSMVGSLERLEVLRDK